MESWLCTILPQWINQIEMTIYIYEYIAATITTI